MSDPFQYNPDLLDGERPPGLSGFMRIRNGEDWLEEAVESHIPYFDEVVAVHNMCTDRTPEILETLRARYPDKIKVISYEPEVYPYGSERLRDTPASSVHSLANYFNFALSQTTFRVATKLDDDHIAIGPAWERMVAAMKARNYELGNEMWCFSGINLVRVGDELRVHAKVPFAGNGDHWFYEVKRGRDFTQDPRFERFNRRGLRTRYLEIAYWHLKYLKKDFGFSNYELEDNPESRYHKQLKRFEAGKEGISLEELGRMCRERVRSRGPLGRVLARLNRKRRLGMERDEGFDLEDLARHLEALKDVVIPPNDPAR